MTHRVKVIFTTLCLSAAVRMDAFGEEASLKRIPAHHPAAADWNESILTPDLTPSPPLATVELGFDALFRPRPKKFTLNVEPILNEVVTYLVGLGIPVTPYRDPRKRRPIGISASFLVRPDMPPVHFHIGEKSPLSLGAFYSPTRSDISWAILWPLDSFRLGIEGGEDSEFGYYAIAGVQWLHPRKPFAAGIGIPMRLKNAEGNVGLIVQVRMNLN